MNQKKKKATQVVEIIELRATTTVLSCDLLVASSKSSGKFESFISFLFRGWFAVLFNVHF